MKKYNAPAWELKLLAMDVLMASDENETDKACRAHQNLLFHDPLPTSFPVQGVFEKAAPPHHIVKVYYTLFAAGLQTRTAERKKARRPRKGPAGR